MSDATGNAVAMAVGCKACPKSTLELLLPAPLKALTDRVGKTETCPNCKTVWTLAEVQVRYLVEVDTPTVAMAIPLWDPTITKTTPVKYLFPQRDSFESYDPESVGIGVAEAIMESTKDEVPK